jgi:hypothetical protein
VCVCVCVCVYIYIYITCRMILESAEWHVNISAVMQPAYEEDI